MALAISGLGSNTAASGSSIALTASAISAGDLVIVMVANRQSTVTVSGISDGTNTYSKAFGAFDGGPTVDCELWYKENASAVASPTITATLSGAASLGVAINAARITGAVTSLSLDKTVHSNTASVSTGTLAQANEIVIGVYSAFGNPPTLTESSGFTTLYNQIANLTNYGVLTSYDIVSATTSVTYNPSQTGGATQQATNVATFKAQASNTANLTVSCTTSVSPAKAAGKALAVVCTTATSRVKTAAKNAAIACTSVTAAIKSAAHSLAVACATVTSAIKSARKAIAVSSLTSTSIAVITERVLLLAVGCTTSVSRISTIAKRIAVSCVTSIPNSLISGVINPIRRNAAKLQKLRVNPPSLDQ